MVCVSDSFCSEMFPTILIFSYFPDSFVSVCLRYVLVQQFVPLLFCFFDIAVYRRTPGAVSYTELSKGPRCDTRGCRSAAVYMVRIQRSERRSSLFMCSRLSRSPLVHLIPIHAA